MVVILTLCLQWLCHIVVHFAIPGNANCILIHRTACKHTGANTAVILLQGLFTHTYCMDQEMSLSHHWSTSNGMARIAANTTKLQVLFFNAYLFQTYYHKSSRLSSFPPLPPSTLHPRFPSFPTPSPLHFSSRPLLTSLFLVSPPLPLSPLLLTCLPISSPPPHLPSYSSMHLHYDVPSGKTIHQWTL